MSPKFSNGHPADYPGMSSISRCPPANKQVGASLISVFLPRMTFPIRETKSSNWAFMNENWSFGFLYPYRLKVYAWILHELEVSICKASKGEDVICYFEPLITQHMGASGLTVGWKLLRKKDLHQIDHLGKTHSSMILHKPTMIAYGKDSHQFSCMIQSIRLVCSNDRVKSSVVRIDE